MVSVRRPGPSGKNKSSSSFSAQCSKTFRIALQIFIAVQLLVFLGKTTRLHDLADSLLHNNPQNPAPPDKNNVVHKVRRKNPTEDEQKQKSNSHNSAAAAVVPHDFEDKHRNYDDDNHHNHKKKNHGPVQHDDAMEGVGNEEEDEMHPHERRQKHDDSPDQQSNKQQHTGNTVLTQHGSGPAKLGYVVDLAQERDHAAFRAVPMVRVEERARTVARQLGRDHAWHPCEHTADHRMLQRADCRSGSTVALTAYNDAPFARYVCGQTIGPGEAVTLSSSDCESRIAHVLPHSDDEVVVVPQGSGNSHQLETIGDCDVPCQFDRRILHAAESSDVAVLTVLGTDWTVTQTKADPYYQAAAKIERTDYRRRHYYSTTSLLSSVPLSFYDSTRYSLRHRAAPAIDFEAAGAKATYLIDKDCSAGRRNKWLAAVEAAMEVESFGSCGHNADPKDVHGGDLHTLEGRRALMQRNRIVLAFEGGTEKDHITSVVWEALLSGAVPAIYGATNLEHRLPPNAAIYANNFNSWDKFAEYVAQVSKDRKLWESFHAWRTDEAALRRFEAQWKFTDTPATCRLCRWAHAKRHGLGWNHTQQVVQETVLPRTLCLGVLDQQHGVVTQPFREVWGPASPQKIQKGSCTTSEVSTQEIATGDFTVERQVVAHDGAVDIVLQRIDRSASFAKDVVLRLEVDKIRNTDGAYFPDTHTLIRDAVRTPVVSSATIQDDRSKVTVLANWVTEIRSPAQGVVEVVVLAQGASLHDDEIRRIRVITEDMNPLHDKMTEFFPSTYGELLMRDFIDPLELYYES